MSEQIKRTVQKPVSKPAEVSAQTPSAPIKRKPSAPKPVVFSIPKGGGIWYKIRQSEVIVYDEAKGYNREIRFCPAERSIFKDEQSDVARREQIVFREGTLLVQHTQPNLIAYLRNHPDNKQNGGRVFIEVDTEVDANAELTREFVMHDAVDIIKTRSIDELMPMALAYGISSDLSSIEIKRALLQQAKGDPTSFMEMIDSPFVKLKALVVTAIDFQIIKPMTDGMRWFDSNALICPTPMGQDTKEVFSRFLMTDRGIAVREELERQVDSL
jgi:hypothetical protein